MVGVGIRVMSTCFLFIDNHVFLPTAEQIETIFEKTIQSINVNSSYVVESCSGFLTKVIAKLDRFSSFSVTDIKRRRLNIRPYTLSKYFL